MLSKARKNDIQRNATPRENMNKKQKGFSLIELLIVVAIILIIAAIAIPNLLRSRMAANEASAVGSIRTINTAAISFSSSYGDGFPGLLSEIGTATPAAALSCKNSQYLDSVLTAGQKSGYNFAIVPGTAVVTTIPTGCTAGFSDGYVAKAVPVTVGTTGQRAFCSDASGVIRFNATGVPLVASPLCTDTTILGQ
jgi:type IV pilus assembly protein PilA